MASQIDVAATPANGWADTAERRFHENGMRQAAQSQGSLFSVSRYVGVADLVARVQSLIQADPDVPCLRSLEIVAHGNPVTADDFPIHDAANWGTQLAVLNWCDEASIYLSGCNTGVSTARSVPSGPLAAALAASMSFQAGTFEVHLTVFGAAGYITGTHAQGNSTVVAEFTTGILLWTEHHEPMVGARDASGNNAWNAFRNW